MEVVIDSLAAGGDGVGRAPDGRVVFVPFTAPGDRVRLRVVESRKHFLRARVETLLEQGAARTEPVCPAFGSCGGCAWQHVSMEAQLAAKVRIVEDALRRIGDVTVADPVTIAPSAKDYGYRARTRVLRQGGRTGYRRRRSNAIQPVSRCPVLAPELDAALHALSSSQDAPDGEIELAAGADAVRCAPLGAGTPVQPIEIQVLSDRLRISPGVFFQANPTLFDPLAQAVVEAAGGGGSALEAFAGAGFLTLALSRRFERITAVESDPAAAADLRHNLARAGRANVDVVAERLERAIASLPAADVLVLDPPRGGLAPDAVPLLSALARRRVVYLSCDPATLARDCARFRQAGFAVRAVSAFDLFPQTPHVETLAVLEPRRGREGGGSVHSARG
jgi:23S rRNA (uracil1939-C5)-methyltransferase